jgi:hypothetical protein
MAVRSGKMPTTSVRRRISLLRRSIVIWTRSGGGALLGEHLGQLLVIGWSVTLSVVILRTRVLPRLARRHRPRRQRDLPAQPTSWSPPCPGGDLARLLGSTGWGLRVAVLGVSVFLRLVRAPVNPPRKGTAPASASQEPLVGNFRARTRRHRSTRRRVCRRTRFDRLVHMKPVRGPGYRT